MTSATRGAAAVRIVGEPVPPLLPDRGPVYVLLVGEAPGPRGADKSGFPFFGDAAGRHLYQALSRLGAVSLPPAIETLPWDGARFRAAALRPVARGVALGNAFDRCPTDDGLSFRAPTRSELEGPENVARLNAELMALQARGLRGVVTLGRVATRTMDVVLAHAPLPTLVMRAVPHPSAQGLLSMAPDRGKGARMADLQEAWMVRCRDLIFEAGYPREHAGAGDE
ncbi:MAG: hypothetical protein IPP90_11555 [Gemmatimonadaceae bacterium]|nr:hypothetical protein [Gemmatimonadaceae bacterium]